MLYVSSRYGCRLGGSEILTNARKRSCSEPQAPVTSVAGSSAHCAWQVLTPSPGQCLEGSGKCVEALLDAVAPGGVGGAALHEVGRDVNGRAVPHNEELPHCHAKRAQERTLGGLPTGVPAPAPFGNGIPALSVAICGWSLMAWALCFWNKFIKKQNRKQLNTDSLLECSTPANQHRCR